MKIEFTLIPQYNVGDDIFVSFYYEGNEFTKIIPNIFNCDSGVTTIIKDVEIISKYWGIDGNPDATFESYEDYVNHPYTKELYFRKLNNPWGTFVNVDSPKIVLTLRIDDDKIEFISYQYDVLPEIWYTENYWNVAKTLDNYEIYLTVDEAINSLQMRDDLFGDRYFPVIKTHLKNKEVIQELAQYFKNCSSPLFCGNSVYFGLRSKPSELHYLKRLYENDGFVLKNKEWDWS